MPILSKKQHKYLINQLNDRIFRLQEAVAARELTNSSEGAKGRHWQYPEAMSATVGDKTDISIAVSDFKTILAEILKLK